MTHRLFLSPATYAARGRSITGKPQLHGLAQSSKIKVLNRFIPCVNLQSTGTLIRCRCFEGKRSTSFSTPARTVYAGVVPGFMAQSLPPWPPKYGLLPHARCFSGLSTPTSDSSSILKSFASACPRRVSAESPHVILNFVNGRWTPTRETYDIVDPLDGKVYLRSSYTKEDELGPFVASLERVPKSGLHNPLKSPERYVLYGQVLRRAAEALHDPEVFQFFANCIIRTFPKSYAQAAGEVRVVRAFCENFSGDSIRFLTRGFHVAGDHAGQLSAGFRWPYGPVAIISPFNFPLEIPALQLLGAVLVGNKVVIKTESTQGLVMEQFLRLLHYCGAPLGDIDFISTRGPVMSQLLTRAPVRLLQFTGGSTTAQTLVEVMKGKIRIEDAGFDWKILGPDVHKEELDYVAWQCDQDAYALSGQKCSAQSLLAAHTNWVSAGIFERLKTLAARRSYADLTLSPILSLSNNDIQKHVHALLQLPGAQLVFGGKAVQGMETVPKKYGTFEPTAVFIPLSSILSTEQNMQLATTELFGPVQVLTEWRTGEEQKLLSLLERVPHHLTAAVVSQDPVFKNLILSNTVNGTTYAGLRARTSGAPQNHWFGPAGDPRAAGIGSPEAIISTWTCHREIIYDEAPVPKEWKMPRPT